MKIIKNTLLLSLLLSLYSAGASAELAFHDPATQTGVLDQVIQGEHAAGVVERAKRFQSLRLTTDGYRAKLCQP